MRSPFKIAPWSPCLSFYFDIAGAVDVGRQRFARKSQLREVYVGFMAIQFMHASFASTAVVKGPAQTVRACTSEDASPAHDVLPPAT